MGIAIEVSDVLSVEAEQMIDRLYEQLMADGSLVGEEKVEDPAMAIQFYLFDSLHTAYELFGAHSAEANTIRVAHRWMKFNADAFNATHPAPVE